MTPPPITGAEPPRRSTRVTYACGWRQWERWCHGRGINPMPAPPEAVAAFLAERAEAGVHDCTLDCYCSGTTHRHRQDGLTDPTADFLVRRIRQGLRRLLGVAPIRQAHPLTVAELGRIVASIDTDDAKDVRDRAILLLGYASAMRPGEISALNIADLQRTPTGVLISIRRSKTDPTPKATSSASPAANHRLTDPIRALDVWLTVSVCDPGALFTRVLWKNHHTSDRIGPRAISRTVQERANTAGFDGIPVTGHSLRAGHATTAAMNGAPIDGSLGRPGTAIWAPCSAITSGLRRLWRRPRATTLVYEGLSVGSSRWLDTLATAESEVIAATARHSKTQSAARQAVLVPAMGYGIRERLPLCRSSFGRHVAGVGRRAGNMAVRRVGCCR